MHGVMLDMNNQNALTSTAMLTAIYKAEQKDTIALLLPFVKCAIGKTTSVNGRIEISGVSKCLSEQFGFGNIPNSVIQKTFDRLTQSKEIERTLRKYVLKVDISEFCRSSDMLLSRAKNDTNNVITSLMTYLNQKKEHLLKKDLSFDEVKKVFEEFLEKSGYYVFSEIDKLRVISISERAIHYHIAQFILNEYEKRTDVFYNIDNIVKGLLLSRVIYGYSNFECEEEFEDIVIFLDTTLLLQAFGFKTREEKETALQLMEILKSSSVPVKCFEHNYEEVKNIINVYANNLRNSARSNGHTLEHFDEYRYTYTDVVAVSGSLGEYFKKHNIDIVKIPSLSGDESGIISHDDYESAIGEAGLKDYLEKNMNYKSESALRNDVTSISSIFIIRRGQSFDRIEDCKAIFVTTNGNLARLSTSYVKSTGGISLLISDLEFTTLLWLKNQKRYSDLPTLKLIEIARISTEPTDQMRTEFNRKIEMLEKNHEITEGKASYYRHLCYWEAEQLMKLIEGNPENIQHIKLADLKEISFKHEDPEAFEEYKRERAKFEASKKRHFDLVKEREDARKNQVTKILSVVTWVGLVTFLALSLWGIINQGLFNHSGKIGIFDIIVVIGSVLGIADLMFSKRFGIKRVIEIIANKSAAKVRNRETENSKRIFEDSDE